MATHHEMETSSTLWAEESPANPNFDEYTLEERSEDLFDFMSNGPIVEVDVNSIIPIGNRIMYLVTLTAAQYDDTGTLIKVSHSTDNLTIDCLTAEIEDRMKQKDRQKYRCVVNNMNIIIGVTTNPFLWNNPVDRRTDH